MPFPKTWTEELIAEWLELDGFLTQTNLPVHVPKAGGRFEADVVGARIKEEGKERVLQIRHVETGTLAGGKTSAHSVKKKFSENTVSSVTEYFKRVLSLENPETTYEKIYVATYWSAPVIRNVTEVGVKVIPLPDFIRDRVLPTVQKAKKNLARRLSMKGSTAMLPESLWLLQMLDYLGAQHMLRKEL